MTLLRIGTVCLALAAGLIPGLAAAQNKSPARLATQARIDILADEAVGEINDGEAVTDNVRVERQNWRKGDEQKRAYSVHAPIVHYAERSISFRFTPERSGKVFVDLMGPWAEVSPNVRAREEVTYSISKVTRADRTDAEADKRPRPYKAWHDERARLTYSVEAGKPVTIALLARAVLPEGMKENPRITDKNSPAHQALQRFKKGANFGNWLEAPRGQDWGQKYSEQDFINVKKEGFDHVRLPIAWHHYTGEGPDFKVEDSMWKTVDEMVDLAEKHQLRLLINIHHFDAFTTDPEGQKAKFLKLWEQISEHYAKRSNDLAFELLNEPKDKATTEVLNPIYAEAIKLIRKTNPNRTIFVGPGQFNQVDQLPRLVLPADDANLIVTVHSYDPFYFTHQATTFSSEDVKPLKGIRFPGPPETPLAVPAGAKPYVKEWIERYNTLPADQNPSSKKVLQSSVDRAKEWSDYYGRPIHYGEFGAYQAADDASRANYYGTFRRAIEGANFGWCLWDWKAGFHYWDSKANAPSPGLRNALFSY